MFKYSSCHSVDRSYVGIWFVLNSSVKISEAATLNREDQSARETSLFTLRRVIIVIILTRLSPYLIHFYLF